MSKTEDIMIIDLFKVIKLLVKNIVPIILCTIFFLILGFFYNSQKSELYLGNANIYMTDEIRLNIFDLYSERIDEITNKDIREEQRNKYNINKENFNDFIKLSSRGKFFENNFYKYYLKEGYTDIESKDLAVNDFQSFSLKKIQNDLLDEGLSFSFLTNNIKRTEGAISETVKDINNQIKSNVLSDYKMLIERSLHMLRHEIELINESIAAHKGSAVQRHKNEILFLKEQSSIANILEMEDSGYNLKIANRQFEELETDMSVRQDFPIYLQGYKAIDRLITLMESRNLETIYETYQEINRDITIQKNRLLELYNDIDLIEFIEDDIETILGNKNLHILDYDPRYNTFVSQHSIFRDVIAFGIIGLFLSCFITIVYKYKDI